MQLQPGDHEYSSAAIYEEIPENMVYDRICDFVPPSPHPANVPVDTLIDDRNMHQNLQIERGQRDYEVAGPSTCNVPVFSRENVTSSFGNSPCGSLQEPPYRTICDCSTPSTSLHPTGACRIEHLETVTTDSERLLSNINRMESSDDESQCESYELDSSPSASSISPENANLVQPSIRSFQDSRT